ncbi:prolyl-tRNA synthetase associated domain-containing protein [Veillonella caviae]|uniref:prolyl-tRNA synthetase associated domain-containing protein n=1 Tax=Veillonella caviae TaxID=248316 RepID=UPI0030B89960
MLQKQDVYNLLYEHNIPFEITDHAPLFSMDDKPNVELLSPDRDAKNLFIRDHKRENYYMITVRGSKRVDLKTFRKDHQLKKISFASEEELWDILKIQPGHVSPFCLLHDTEHKVHYFIDSDYKEGLIGIHPNKNDATVWLKGADLIFLLEEQGTTVEYIEI